jgi:drug/metabolite transporter (DMT)-like permease
VVYIAGLATGTAIFLAPVVLVQYREECRAAWRDHKRASVWIGLGSMGAYLLILVAFRQANASYIVAARELSIAVAVALGVAILKEPLTPAKAISGPAIMVGVVLVKLA